MPSNGSDESARLTRKLATARQRLEQRINDLADMAEWREELEWRIMREWGRLDKCRGQMTQFLALVEDVHEFSRTCEAICNKRKAKQ